MSACGWTGDPYPWLAPTLRPWGHCPSCGHCPTCGRSGYSYHGPWHGVIPPWPTVTIPTTWTDTPLNEPGTFTISTSTDVPADSWRTITATTFPAPEVQS